MGAGTQHITFLSSLLALNLHSILPFHIVNSLVVVYTKNSLKNHTVKNTITTIPVEKQKHYTASIKSTTQYKSTKQQNSTDSLIYQGQSNNPG